MVLSKKSVWSLGLTGLIILMLVFSGPASAASVFITPPSAPAVRQGEYVDFYVDLDLNYGELTPSDVIKIVLQNASTTQEIWFYPNGTVVNTSWDVKVTLYQNVTSTYGYGYGYGYGYEYPSYLSFHVNMSTSKLLGNYTIYAKYRGVNSSDTYTLEVYPATATVDMPPSVTIYEPPHLANLSYLDNWIVAEITDDYGITNVSLILNGVNQTLIPDEDIFWMGSTYAMIVKNVSYTTGAWNNISVAATDTAGNTTVQTIRVWVNPKRIVINRSVTAGTSTNVDAENYTNFDIEFVPNATDSNITIEIEGDTDVSNFGIGTNADFINNASAIGVQPVLKFVKVEVNGTNVSSSRNLSWVVVKMYYTDADLDRTGDGDANDPGDIDETKLVLLRFCNLTGVWERVTATDSPICNGTITVYGNGVNTTANYVWANLSHLSVFGIGGSVIPPPPSAPVSAGATPHSVKVDIKTMDGIKATAGETITIKIPIYSESQEPGVSIFIRNLPEGWRATEIKGITLPKGESEAEINVTIPEDAEGTYKLLAVAVKTWFGEVSSREFSITVTKPGVKPVEEVKPPEKVKPGVPEVKPPEAKPPVEKKPPAVKPPEEVKPPEKKVEKPAVRKPRKKLFGVCGPSILALLGGISALLLRRNNRY